MKRPAAGRPDAPELEKPRSLPRRGGASDAADCGQIRQSYNAQKRGGGAQKVELDEVALVAAAQSKEVIELNEALERLGELDARKAQIWS